MTRDEELNAKWADANRISDQIVDMINAELIKPGFSPMQMLAGQMLALLSLMSTTPAFRPQEITDAQAAVQDCLAAMFAASKDGKL